MAGAAGLHVGRWVWLTLALGMPLLVHTINETHEAKLRALMTRGRPTVGYVTNTSRSGNKNYAHYRYTVGGSEYRWDIGADRVPGVGGRFPLMYRPEKPKDHWVAPPLTEQVIAEELRLGRRAVYITFAVFATAFALNEYQLRRRQVGLPRAVLGPRGVAYLLAIIFYAIFVGVLFDANVRAVLEKAFGPRPLGMPNVLFAFLLLTILYLPALIFIPHIAVLVTRANPHGQLLSKSQVNQGIRELIRADPQLRRSNRIAIFGVLYFLTLAVTWIVYASISGI